jgi:hypothetical protein
MALKTLVFLQAYEGTGACSSNSPQRQNFKWTRETTDFSTSNALSETFQIAPGDSQTLFSGTVALTQDNTTTYSIALVPFNTSLYQFTYVSGAIPGFATLRSIGTDATSQVTTTLNGPVFTYTFTGGTLPNLSSVQPGDEVLIGNVFNAVNQGIWQIISKTSDSISIVNPIGYDQGPITLGSGYATQLRIFSSTSVQIGNTLVVSSGFSPVSQNSYNITQVTDRYLQFSYAGSLPAETVTTEVEVYSMNKTFVYMEADQKIEILINGAVSGPIITPPVSNGVASIGAFMINSDIYSLSVTNNSITTANVTLLSTE